MQVVSATFQHRQFHSNDLFLLKMMMWSLID